MFERFAAYSSQFSWLGYVVEIGLLILAALFVRGFGMRWFHRRARTKPGELHSQLMTVMDKALVPILLLAVLAASLNLFPIPGKVLLVLNRIIYASFLIFLLYYGAKAAQILVNQWIARSAGGESMREPAGFLIRAVFLVFGIMLVLENLGISLTALWTTLGVGSVAVALALQDTLSNFFGGVYLLIDQPVRVGDYVKLGTGEEGYVIQLGWRSTRVRTLSNNIVVVPNSKLATQTVTNYSLPSEEYAFSIPINVSYDSDPEAIERILLEEAKRDAAELPALRQSPPPSVRFIPGFGDSALNFSLNCSVARYADQFDVQHVLRKRILARFRREGISMPFPQRDVHLYQQPSAPSRD